MDSIHKRYKDEAGKLVTDLDEQCYHFGMVNMVPYAVLVNKEHVPNFYELLSRLPGFPIKPALLAKDYYNTIQVNGWPLKVITTKDTDITVSVLARLKKEGEL